MRWCSPSLYLLPFSWSNFSGWHMAIVTFLRWHFRVLLFWILSYFYFLLHSCLAFLPRNGWSVLLSGFVHVCTVRFSVCFVICDCTVFWRGTFFIGSDVWALGCLFLELSGRLRRCGTVGGNKIFGVGFEMISYKPREFALSVLCLLSKMWALTFCHEACLQPCLPAMVDCNSLVPST